MTIAKQESQFSAGTACEPCHVLGHFCPAQDFNAADDPACSACLQGVMCARRRAQAADLSGPVLPVSKPNPYDKRAMCQYGCGRKRHSGICNARRAAIARGEEIPPRPGKGEKPMPTVKYERPDIETKAPVPEMEHSDTRDWEMTVDSHEVRFDAVEKSSGEDIAPTAAAGLPIFEVVPSDSVPWRRTPGDDGRYATLLAELKALACGQSLTMRFGTPTAADLYAKNLRRVLRRFEPPARYERHGALIYFAISAKKEVSPR